MAFKIHNLRLCPPRRLSISLPNWLAMLFLPLALLQMGKLSVPPEVYQSSLGLAHFYDIVLLDPKLVAALLLGDPRHAAADLLGLLLSIIGVYLFFSVCSLQLSE